MKFDVIVLGAGITGITTAYYLHTKGFKVAVVDRQDKAGEETSYANGGQLSVSHAEPWANPTAPLQVAKWLVNKNSPLYFKPSINPHQWLWMAEWLNNCRSSKCDFNMSELTKLALESQKEINYITKITGVKYDLLSKGIIHFYTNKKDYDRAVYAAKVMRDNGLDIHEISKSEIFNLEPSLKHNGKHIIGGTLAPSDQSGDAYKFCQGIVEYLETRGVKFFFNTAIVNTIGSKQRADGVKVVDLNDQDRPIAHALFADRIVVCLGSFSYQFVNTNYNKRLSIYPAKGSSITVPVVDDNYAPTVSLTDDENKIVISRLGNRLRVAGTAELAGWDSSVNVNRCKVVLKHARNLFEKGCDWTKVEYWSGLRPATPSNLPYVEKLAGTHNVFLNTGHGTLGWTLSCGSAKRLSEIVLSDKIKE